MDTTRAGYGNRYDTGPTIAVGAGELRAGWNDGLFVGDNELTDWARGMIASRTPVHVFAQVIECDNTPLGALAALASYAPGRVIVTAAPDDVVAIIDPAFEDGDDE